MRAPGGSLAEFGTVGMKRYKLCHAILSKQEAGVIIVLTRFVISITM